MSENSTLDRIDRQLVAALRKNARLSNKELAARVGLSASSCLERVRRLESRGVLRGYHAEVDPRALGVGLQAVVAVRLSRHSRALVDSFREHVLGTPEVRMVYHVAGASDFLLHVAVRDPEHLRELVLSAFTVRPEVAHVETALIFEQLRNPELPFFSGSPGDDVPLVARASRAAGREP